MATAFVPPITTHLPANENREVLIASNGVSKSSFLRTTKLLSPLPSYSISRRSKSLERKWFKGTCLKKSSSDHIPKQFRQENLQDGLMDNYKNAPQYLYGLSPQMDMFMTEDNPIRRQSEAFTECCKSDVYTVNCGMAYGQAAMLLLLGTKGYCTLQPNSSTKLYLPKVNRSSRAVVDMWIKAKERDVNTEYYIELLAKGIGKSKEEISKDIQRPKYFQAQGAIDYGIADKIIDSRNVAFEKRRSQIPQPI
ncbi:hypothetical protein Ancab_027873 [Ancistrocladus abbreviatus]